MYRKFTLLLTIAFLSCYSINAQKLKPGFDLTEYKDLFALSVKNYYPGESQEIPYPANYVLAYSSPSMGLENKWELWITPAQTAVISIRGTTAGSASSLANMYAAMVPAKGELKFSEENIFRYELSSDPNAAVHVGWLISTAFLSNDILPRIDSCYKAGIKDFYITGHSQGGAISFLLSAWLYNVQKNGIIPADVRFKTYCTAGPKPGNQFFANDYSVLTQDGWGYNVINANDWVPETFLTVQKTGDLNDPNIFNSVKAMIQKQSFFKRLIGNHLYNKINKPSLKAQKKYQKYFGKLVSKGVKKQLPGFVSPAYYPSSNYVQAGNLYVLHGDENYFKQFPHDASKLMQYHQPMAYYYLINQYIEKGNQPAVFNKL